MFTERQLFDHHECRSVPLLEETVLKFYFDSLLADLQKKQEFSAE